MKNLVIITGLLSLLSLAGCGQKGDLYKSTDAPPPQMEEAKDSKPAE